MDFDVWMCYAVGTGLFFLMMPVGYLYKHDRMQSCFACYSKLYFMRGEAL